MAIEILIILIPTKVPKSKAIHSSLINDNLQRTYTHNNLCLYLGFTHAIRKTPRFNYEFYEIMETRTHITTSSAHLHHQLLFLHTNVELSTVEGAETKREKGEAAVLS